MSKNKKIIFGIAATIVIIAAGIIIYKMVPPGTGPLLPSEEELKNCSVDEDCLIVGTINGLDYFPQDYQTCDCLCVTAINKKYKTLWEEEKTKAGLATSCDILCKPCGFDLTNSQAKCENNQCVVGAKSDTTTTDQITITTDKSEYNQGEMMQFTIANHSTKEILVSACPQGEGFVEVEKKNEQEQWEKELVNQCFANCVGPYTLETNGSHSYNWQDFFTCLNDISELNPPGNYRIKFGYLTGLPYTEENTRWIYSNEFRIVEKGESTPNETSLKDCSQNSDCIKVLINPCTSALKICKATAINKNYKDDWDNLLANCAETGVACQETTPGDITFTMDPECVNQRCELTKQRPYTVAPYCGAKTTDHLISFGWFPVDYESKHLIQIDNNADFSSPEIETYETASGIFTPESPLANGTYYWRVKSTKSEKEKCIAPPCAPSEDPNDPCNIAIESYKQCKAQYSKWSDVCMITIETF